ncbi:nitroreductase family protein [Candidatus Pacearchaeota archaeon]|nr:nitroreductase family protein [Candidatus Pacearchaeota archaeon]
MELDHVLRARRSVRKFKMRSPDWRDILEAIDSARFTPMAGNNYTPRFILVSEADKIKKIAAATQQAFVGTAKYIIVVCSIRERPILAYGPQAENWIKHQAGAAIQNFMLKLTEKGLSTCWISHFVEKIVKETLSISDDISVEAVFPIGYEFEKPKTRKAKIELNSILYFEKFGEKRMKALKRFDV